MDDHESKERKGKEVLEVLIPILRPPHQFLQRLKKSVEEEKYQKFISMLKELMMNILLVDALEQVQGYTRFMKNLLTKEWKMSFAPMEKVHHCSAIVYRSLVEKKKDPEAFTI